MKQLNITFYDEDYTVLTGGKYNFQKQLLGYFWECGMMWLYKYKPKFRFPTFNIPHE